MKSTKKILEKFTVNQLNKLIEKNVPCMVYENYHGWIMVENWQWLEPNENFADPENEDYQYSDGSFCGLVAEAGGHHYPYMTLGKVMVGKEIKIK
jgi:hypothetical protein